MAKALSGVLLLLATCLLAGQAAAQTRDNYFARDRNISVRERARPGYQALGMPLGAFIAYPRVELGIQNNSNIYATASNAKDDTIGLINPVLEVESRWSRNSLSAFVRGASRQYVSTTAENTTDWQLGGKGQLDLGDSTLALGGDYGYLANPRTASVGTGVGVSFPVHPVEYYGSHINADLAHTFNRLKVEGTVNYSSAQFVNAKNAAGAIVLETPFNNTHTVASGKAGYAISPDTAVYVSAAYNSIYFPNQSVTASVLNRNSTGEIFDVGANFDITEILRGDVEVGYLRQQFAASGFKTVTGLHALGKLEWFPTQMTTVTLSGERSVAAATVPGSPAVVASGISGQVDHELTRNIILTGIAHYAEDDYQGIARRDRLGELTVSGDYLVNRNVGLHLAYNYLSQNSSGALKGASYNDHRITLSATLQY